MLLCCACFHQMRCSALRSDVSILSKAHCSKNLVFCSDADSKLNKPKTVIFRVKRLCSGKKAKLVQSFSNCSSMSAFNMLNEA